MIIPLLQRDWNKQINAIYRTESKMLKVDNNDD